MLTSFLQYVLIHMPTLFSPNIHLLMTMSGGSNLTVFSFQYEQHLRHVRKMRRFGDLMVKMTQSEIAFK